MHQIILAAAAAAAAAPQPAPEAAIVVTASREPVTKEATAASTTVLPEEKVEALGVPSTVDMLRLIPGVAVSASGSRGALTEVRIRGAEAKHSLLFVDGIRFNDPALGNVARFELLTSDALSRIEVVRGPQSALWGSEALGGVIALETADPLRQQGLSALAEYGSLDTVRTSVQGAARNAQVGIAAAAGRIRTEGIDIRGPSGERDGFDNRTVSVKLSWQPSGELEAGVAGHRVAGKSEYDGYDPVTFAASEAVETRNRIGAARAWLRATRGQWTLSGDTSFLDSNNRNLFEGAPVNRTYGERLTAGVQASRRFGAHRVTIAAEHEAEEFHARDQAYGGATEQDRTRTLHAVVGEWRADWGVGLSTGVAVRHDDFSAFTDATTVRAEATFALTPRLRLHASYGEGIAQPTFYDLFGFYPEFGFQGNPNLRPESSRAWEAGVRWAATRTSLAVTGFSQNLADENLLVFNGNGSTTVNADGESRRRGVELEFGHAPSQAVTLQANYTYLDAKEQRTAAGLPVREQRRPRHSGSLLATGRAAPLELGVSLAYVGERIDTDFDVFPSHEVRLDEYVLASLRASVSLTRRLEAYVRAENGFGARYQDVVGYNTAGRTVYAGLRLRLGS